MVDWTQVLVALAVGLPATIAAIGAVITTLRTSRKVDENTKLTREGSARAVTNAAVAADAASGAKIAAESLAKNLDRKLNGELDARIEAAVKAGVDTVLAALTEHTNQDEQNMSEIRNALIKLKKP